MLTESILRPPSRAYFVKRYEWQLKALREHEENANVVNCGAEILSVITFHYDNPSANEKLTWYIKNARKTQDEFYDHGEWMPYSVSYMELCLLSAYTKYQITPAFELLVRINFLDDKVPADIKDFYKSGKTTWYRLNYQVIQKWIDTNYKTINKVMTSPVQELVKKADKYTPIVNALCDWHRLVHKKQASYVYDSKRKAMIKKHLQKDKRTVYDCAKAIIGNLYSDFHQATHKDNDKNNGGTVYNCVKYIFENAEKFEKHLKYAEKAGIKDDFVKREYDKFVETGTCAFASRTPNVVIDEKRAKTNTDGYVNFASSVFTYLGSPTFDIDNVIELCSENTELKKLMSDISDTEILTEIVLDRMKIYGGLTQNHKDRIAEFCQKIIKEKRK
jgi:hypothetical protein